MTRKKNKNKGRAAHGHRGQQLGPSMTRFKRGLDNTPKRKFYAVRKGVDGFSGVVNTWDECRLYVDGVSGARYKSFKTLAEAQSFVDIQDPPEATDTPASSAQQLTEQELEPLPVATPPSDAPSELEVYTDGACFKNGKEGSKAGYGVYFGEQSPYNVSEPVLVRPTNQRAEMMAVLEALQIVREHGLVARNGTVKIYTDSMVRFRTLSYYLSINDRYQAHDMRLSF